MSDIKKYIENLSEKLESNIDFDLLILLDKIPNYFRKTHSFHPPIAEHLKNMAMAGIGLKNGDADYLSVVIVIDNPAKAIGISLIKTVSSIDYFPRTISYRVTVFENINLNFVRKENGELDYWRLQTNFPIFGSTQKYEREYVCWHLWPPIRWLIDFFQKGNVGKDRVNLIFQKLSRLEDYLNWLIENPELNKIQI